MKTSSSLACFYTTGLGGEVNTLTRRFWRWSVSAFTYPPLKRIRKSKKKKRRGKTGLCDRNDIGRCDGMLACVYTYIYTRVA